MSTTLFRHCSECGAQINFVIDDKFGFESIKCGACASKEVNENFMTTKPWGDEPANPDKSYVECAIPMSDRKEYRQQDSYGGFTKLERACIDLKVPDPALDPKLRELILESRRLDYAGQAITMMRGAAEAGLEQAAFWAYEYADAMISELEKK